MAEKKKSVYANIADDILDKIKNGVYTIGSLLPPEREFMSIYKVQRTTVRRGLDLLSNEGFIKKVAGLGSVVQSTVPVKTESAPVAPVYPVQKTANKDFSILLPDSNMDKLPRFVIDLISVLGKNGAYITSSFEDAAKKHGVVAIDTNPDTENGVCLALCQSDERRSVILDNDKSAYVALTYLESLGHSKIAFIGTDSGFAFENAAYDAFSTVNSYFDDELVMLTGSTEKSGFDGFSELFRRHGNKFSAICAVNDDVAKGIIKAAKYYKLNVHDDLSVISLCSHDKNSGIDAIYYDTSELSEEILYSLENSGRISTVMFGGNLSVKGTCGKIKDNLGNGKGMSNFLL